VLPSAQRRLASFGSAAWLSRPHWGLASRVSTDPPRASGLRGWSGCACHKLAALTCSCTEWFVAGRCSPSPGRRLAPFYTRCPEIGSCRACNPPSRHAEQSAHRACAPLPPLASFFCARLSLLTRSHLASFLTPLSCRPACVCRQRALAPHHQQCGGYDARRCHRRMEGPLLRYRECGHSMSYASPLEAGESRPTSAFGISDSLCTPSICKLHAHAVWRVLKSFHKPDTAALRLAAADLLALQCFFRRCSSALLECPRCYNSPYS